MATENRYMKKSTPDETIAGNGTYDDTVNSAENSDESIYASLIGTGEIVFPDAGTGNSAYQQWLQNQGVDLQGQYAQSVKQAQQAYSQALAANKRAYEQQLTTYGAAAENLAKSGLSASGYSDYLAGQAYAAQQAANTAAGQQYAMQQQSALKTAQEQSQAAYSEYLSQVNQQAQDIYSTLQSTGGKLSDEAKKYYETAGYSPDAIAKAETLYSQYTATPEYKQAQAQGAQSALLSGQTVADVTSSYDGETVGNARKNISQITDQAAKGVSKQAILSQLGYDVANMDNASQNAAYQKALGMASSNSGRAAFVDNQIKVAQEKETNDDYVSELQNIADVLLYWKNEGVSQENLQELSAKILQKFGLSGFEELGKEGAGTLKYTYGNKEYKEMWHLGSGVNQNNDPDLLKKLNMYPDTQSIAVEDGKVYVRSSSGPYAWWKIDGLDGRTKNVLSTIAKIQTATA